MQRPMIETKQRTKLAAALFAGLIALAAGLFFVLRRPPPAEPPTKAPSGEPRAAAPTYVNRALFRGTSSPKEAPDEKRSPSISGTIYDMNGNTIDGAVVSASTFEVSGNRLSVSGTSKSEGGGRFSMELPGGMYQVSASMEGYAPASATVASGETISLVMQRAAVIEGHVYSADGSPMPHFAIDLISVVPTDLAAPPPLWSGSVHDPDGAYRVDQVPSWAVVVRATATGYAPTFSPPIKVAAGDTRSVDIRLSKGCTVSGVAVDEAGAPLPGVAVTAESRMVAGALGDTSVASADDVWSGDDGHFQLESVPVGQTVIRGYDGENAVSSVNLSIESCTSALPVRLVMAKGGGLSGVARRADGTPLPNANLSLTKRSIGFVSATTDSAGRFSFEKLPAGKARLELIYQGQRTLDIVSVTSGAVTEHDITLPAQGTGGLKGRVTAGGTPLAGARLLVASNIPDTESVAMYYPVTDKEGSFNIESLAAGAYLVNVLSTAQAASVQVNPDEVATMDINVVAKKPSTRAKRTPIKTAPPANEVEGDEAESAEGAE